MAGTAYHPLAKALHWLTALCVLGLIAVGLWMTEMPISLMKLQLYAWHKWLGLLVLLITFGRLVFRLRSPPPPLPNVVIDWERRMAPYSHGLLLFLLLALPFSGWLMSSAGGVTVYWFGVLRLPDLVPRDLALFEGLRRLHHVLAWSLVALLALHVLAVLHHDVIRRDGIFRRMWL